MSEKRFILCQDDFGNYEIRYDEDVFHFLWEVAPILNEQQATIQFLQNEIDELKKDIDIYKYEEKKHSETARKLYEENEQLKEQVQILNKCCRHKSSDEYVKQAYADLNRREREKHSQGNATYIAKINQNEVIY